LNRERTQAAVVDVAVSSDGATRSRAEEHPSRSLMFRSEPLS
jgi:hypothetical protein